jgi:hypothetical protein
MLSLDALGLQNCHGFVENHQKLRYPERPPISHNALPNADGSSSCNKNVYSPIAISIVFQFTFKNCVLHDVNSITVHYVIEETLSLKYTRVERYQCKPFS